MSGEDFRFARESTIGIEFYILHGVVGKTHYKIQVWDCAGQDRFRSIVKSYFRGANVVLAVFDVTNRKSFEMLNTWIKETRQQIPNETIIGLLGNKIDLKFPVVSTKEAQNLIQELNCDFYLPVSAASRKNIEEAVNKSLRLVHEQNLDGIISLKQNTPPSLNLSKSKFTFAKSSRCSGSSNCI